MALRGPDGTGTWLSGDARVGFVHRRLAIIDLSNNGAQPMSTPDGRLCITFNGEIYNYQELRRELLGTGQVLRSNSDTEVLLHLYLRDGPAMLRRLRGMFAFAIWDEREQTLFMARDPFGIKPLYYSDDGGTLRFASQVKALLSCPAVSRTPEPAGHVGFFVLGSVPEPFTLFKAIRALPAGHTYLARAGGTPQISSYFDVSSRLAQAPFPSAGEDRDASLAAVLADSVQSHLVADVPVGVFLSAGVDSTVIASLASRVHAPVRTFTLAFQEYRGRPDDESLIAEATARELGTDHVTHTVSARDFFLELDAILAAMDQPSIDGINTYFVSRIAAQSGLKVALSGLGSDEIFGGYPSFRQVPRARRLVAPFNALPGAGRALRFVSRPVLERLGRPKLAGAFEYGGSYEGAYLLRRALYMPWELPDFLDPETVRAGWEDLHLLARLRADAARAGNGERQVVSSLETTWYMRNQLLRDADWAGMAHSLEIRVPFVDVPVFDRVASQAKAVPYQKSDLVGVAPAGWRAANARRAKTGFRVPVREWIQAHEGTRRKGSEYRSWARKIDPACLRKRSISVLTTDSFGRSGGIAKFNRDFLTALANHHATERIAVFERARARPSPLPAKVDWKDAGSGKLAYALRVIAFHAAHRRDAVVCGHINLLPVACVASVLAGARLVLVVHGIEAWSAAGKFATRHAVRCVDFLISVSQFTRDRFANWARMPHSRSAILPNCIDMAAFGIRPKDPVLARRLALEGKRVILTVGRLDSRERYKGHDEVMDALAVLVEEHPDLVYLIVGDGDDVPRLKQKAVSMGLADRVVFAGFVSESDKHAYYSLADAFVMPGRGEGFGIVYLEAMASGLPVVASMKDGSKEALRDGSLGLLVDPDVRAQVVTAIREILRRPKCVPDDLEYFDTKNFVRRCHAIIEGVYAQ